MTESPFTRAVSTLQDANVNSNVAVKLYTDNERTRIEVFAKTGETAYNDLTGTFDNRLNSGRYMGFKNPAITLKGYFYITENTANYLTYSLLKDFVRSAAVKTLVSNVHGTIKVLLTGVDISDNNSTNGVVDLTLTFEQVKNE